MENQTDQPSAKKPQSTKQRLYISVLLALMALVSVTVATLAWFTIADFTKIHSMSIEITSGTNLRFDLDAHENFDEYIKSLNFEQIADRIKTEKGYDLRQIPLKPVTTTDCVHFTYENGNAVSDRSGAYLEFTLHFMATEDMLIHLTGADTNGFTDGTAVLSENEELKQAMRISFSIGDQHYIYHPAMEDICMQNGNIREFGLGTGERMVLSANNQLFWLEKNTDQPVIVRIWLEGTDEACTDDLRSLAYQIRLRFVGTDRDNNILSGERK